MPALPSVLIRISTGEILNRTLYPRDDMAAVEGLDPDLEWMVIRTPFPVPNYDPRYFNMVTTEERGPDPDAEFTHLHPWNVTYSTTKRPVEQIKLSARNKERLELSRHLSDADALKFTLMVVTALAREQKGLALTPREQAALDQLTVLAVKVQANDDRGTEIVAQIELGQEPDLDAGWAEPAAVVVP